MSPKKHIKFDDTQLKEFEKDLKAFADKAYPFATKATINHGAFFSQKAMRFNIKRKMVNRNQFTQRSVHVDMSRTLKVSRQSATVGSVADYMEDQEFGGSTNATGRNRTRIPTSWLGRGSYKGRSRPKPVTKGARLNNVKLTRRAIPPRGGWKSNRQRAFVTALMAAQDGEKYVFVKGGSKRASDGIYRVWGKKKRNGRYTGVRMRMAYSFRRNPTPLHKIATLNPAIIEAEKRMPAYYRDALKAQLERRGIQLRLI